MALNEEFLMELKMRNDIESVIGGYVNLKRAGSTMKGLCPFHNEKTPSFTVYPENGSYYCFGCGAGGDVITFIRQIENLDYMEAIRFLAERSGLNIPQDGGYDDSMQKLKTNIYAANREAARFFHSALLSPEGKPALDYLLGRQLSMATIKHFGIGYAFDSWDRLRNHLRSKGFNDQEMVIANLIVNGKSGSCYDRFRNRVMFPIIDLRGNVIAFSGREMPGVESKGQKYVNTSDTPVFKKSHHIFAMNFAKNSCAERIILVEGQMDAISLHQAGITNAVASQGTAFTAEQAKLISRYTKEVVIAMDSDGAGKKATDKVMRLVSETGLPVKIVRVPDGKDPDEFVKMKGGEAFRTLIDSASGDIEYKLISAREGFDLATNDGVRRYLNAAAEILADCDDMIARDLYAGRLSASYGVSKDTILATIKNIFIRKSKARKKREFKEIIQPKSDGPINRERRIHMRAASAEETVLSLLMLNPDFSDRVEQSIDESFFLTDFNRRIFAKLSAIIRTGQTFDISLMSEDFDPAEMGEIVKLQNKGAGRINAKQELEDCLKVMKEEKEKLSINNVDKLSSDEWEANLEKLRQMKKGDR